jgi:hypothetical protein
MKCPYSDIQCDFVDTSGMDKPVECKNCIRNSDPAVKLMNTYPLEQMLNMLPKTIVKDRKKAFRYNDIFDITITRDGLDNWVISYTNDKSSNTLFITIYPDIHQCCAIMMAELIENKYLPEDKTISELLDIPLETKL